MPLLKVEVTEVPVIFKTVDSMPPAKVEVAAPLKVSELPKIVPDA